MEIRCSNCGRSFPGEGVPYRCIACGGIFDFKALPDFDPGLLRSSVAGGGSGLPRGIWRFRPALGLPEDAPEISLGEGNTPLVWGKAFGREVAFKLEFLNPTGSFKDRGSAVLVSFLRSRWVDEAVEDSSGNAGASFAAYAARGGMRARVYVPGYAAGPKRTQIEVYGAEVVSTPGTRSDTADAVRQAAENGAVYASHAYLPHGLAGYATLAYELVEDLGASPGTVIVPAGQGNLALAIGRGFGALRKAGVIAQTPQLIAVQARACAPLWAVSQYGVAGLSWVTEGGTLAEGVRIKHPIRGDAVLQEVGASGGAFVAVGEDEILAGRDALARQGLYVEPTSAIVWSALAQTVASTPEPIAVVLTGSGLKYRG